MIESLSSRGGKTIQNMQEAHNKTAYPSNGRFPCGRGKLPIGEGRAFVQRRRSRTICSGRIRTREIREGVLCASVTWSMTHLTARRSASARCDDTGQILDWVNGGCNAISPDRAIPLRFPPYNHSTIFLAPAVRSQLGTWA